MHRTLRGFDRLSTVSGARASRRIFYGWYVVGAAFLSFFLAFGFIYSFGIFAQPIANVIHYDVEGVTALFSISYFVFLMAGCVTGFISDRVGGHWVVAAGGILIGIGLFAAGRATTNLEISAAFALGVGLGMACIYVPATDVVETWFVRKRGYATGLTVGGWEAGNLVIPAVATLAILRLGVRPALVGFGLAMLVLIPIAALIMSRRPEDMGLYPDGSPDPPPVSEDDAAGSTLLQAIRTRPFWQIYLAIFFASFGIFLPFTHLAPRGEIRRSLPRPAWLR